MLTFKEETWRRSGIVHTVERSNRLALTLALLSCASVPVFGAGDVGNFNFNETTGLINIPIARVAKAGTFKLFAQPTAIGRVSVFGGLDDSLFANDGTQKTIIGLGKGMEMSLAMFTGVQKLDSFVLGFKWNAIEATEDTPGFSVGIQSIGAGVRPFNGASVFGVASHSFKLNDDDMAIDLHAGIGTNRLRNGFGGIEFHFNDTWSLIGEHDGTIQSAGIRFKPHERIDIMPVLQFHSNNQVHAGFSLGYTFGGFSDKKSQIDQQGDEAEVKRLTAPRPDEPVTPEKSNKVLRSSTVTQQPEVDSLVQPPATPDQAIAPAAPIPSQTPDGFLEGLPSEPPQQTSSSTDENDLEAEEVARLMRARRPAVVLDGARIKQPSIPRPERAPKASSVIPKRRQILGDEDEY
jgi:hypothetical protein